MTKHRGYTPRPLPASFRGDSKNDARLRQRHERRQVDREEFRETFRAFSEMLDATCPPSKEIVTARTRKEMNTPSPIFSFVIQCDYRHLAEDHDVGLTQAS